MVDAVDWSFFVRDIVVERGEFLGFLFLLLLDVLLGIVNDEKLLLGAHLASNVAAIQCAIPLFLIFFRLKLHVDVEPFLVLLYGEHDEYVWLGVVIHVLDFV